MDVVTKYPVCLMDLREFCTATEKERERAGRREREMGREPVGVSVGLRK